MSATPVRTNVPDEPGLYWYRMNGAGTWRHQEVYRQPMNAQGVKKGTLVVNNGEGPIPVTRPHRHWRKQLKKPR